MPEVATERAQVSLEASRAEDLERILEALDGAMNLARTFGTNPTRVESKPGRRRKWVTDLDLRINRYLHAHLPRREEGWLSEESPDSAARLQRRRVWIVDPLDGTIEFLEGIPEWCISIGLVEDGEAIAGGIVNPATGTIFLGAAGMGVTCNGEAVPVRPRPAPGHALVLASRSEWKRSEWARWTDGRIRIEPTGSIAYKLACVAAGLADATWTFAPKHEWDVAAGVALVIASGGVVRTPEGHAPVFNRTAPLLSGLLAFSSKSAGVLEPIARERANVLATPNRDHITV